MSTLYRWTKRWDQDPLYDPSDKSIYGKINRIFTDDQEQSITDYIDNNYIKAGNYFSGIHFQTLAYDAYDEIFVEKEDQPEFSCSPTFIQSFKERHNISSRMAHFRQRPNNKTKDQITSEFENFRHKIIELI